jgi:hypothetical protein
MAGHAPSTPEIVTKMCPPAGDSRRVFVYAGGMNPSDPEYTSFLIRLWREPPASLASQATGYEWLVQVEHISSGEKQYFASLDGLFAFIRAQLPGPPQKPVEPVGKSTVKGGRT